MRYIRSSNQIASKNKTYAMADITEVQMYEWVKTQEVDLAGFQAWIHHHMTLSHQEGYVQGFDTAVVSVDYEQPSKHN